MVSIYTKSGSFDISKGDNTLDSLIAAVQSRNVALVQIYLAENPELLNSRNYNGQTALHYAATDPNNFLMVEKLLKAKANYSTKDNFGETPLHKAALNNCLSIVILLLEKGANPNEPDNHGFTPLFYAGLKGHLKVLKELIKFKADIHHRAINGKTALEVMILLERKEGIHILSSENENEFDSTNETVSISDDPLIEPLTPFEKQLPSPYITSKILNEFNCPNPIQNEKNKTVVRSKYSHADGCGETCVFGCELYSPEQYENSA